MYRVETLSRVRIKVRFTLSGRAGVSANNVERQIDEIPPEDRRK